MKLPGFISERPVLKNILFMLLVFALLIVITMTYLRFYTLHGKTIAVPDFTGLTIDKIDGLATQNNLKYIINDSIYDFKKPKGTVALQDPPAGFKVKQGRKIYLTVIAQMPEQVNVPNLIDLSLRQATSMLETYGLKLGRIEYTHSEFKNAVLEQKYKGRQINPDMTVKIGSTIDLVLGDGLNIKNVVDTISKDTII
jgi:eukaryotic-like serine/threonine-protein kinase